MMCCHTQQCHVSLWIASETIFVFFVIDYNLMVKSVVIGDDTFNSWICFGYHIPHKKGKENHILQIVPSDVVIHSIVTFV